MWVRNTCEHYTQDNSFQYDTQHRLNNDQPGRCPARLRPCVAIADGHLGDGGKREGLYIVSSPIQTTGVKSYNQPPNEGPDEENNQVNSSYTAYNVDCVQLYHRNEEICGSGREEKIQKRRNLERERDC